MNTLDVMNSLELTPDGNLVNILPSERKIEIFFPIRMNVQKKRARSENPGDHTDEEVEVTDDLELGGSRMEEREIAVAKASRVNAITKEYMEKCAISECTKYIERCKEVEGMERGTGEIKSMADSILEELEKEEENDPNTYYEIEMTDKTRTIAEIIHTFNKQIVKVGIETPPKLVSATNRVVVGCTEKVETELELMKTNGTIIKFSTINQEDYTGQTGDLIYLFLDTSSIPKETDITQEEVAKAFSKEDKPANIMIGNSQLGTRYTILGYADLVKANRIVQVLTTIEVKKTVCRIQHSIYQQTGTYKVIMKGIDSGVVKKARLIKLLTNPSFGLEEKDIKEVIPERNTTTNGTTRSTAIWLSNQNAMKKLLQTMFTRQNRTVVFDQPKRRPERRTKVSDPNNNNTNINYSQ